jgi:putative transcriptional regulator
MISDVVRIKLDELLEAKGKTLYRVAKDTGIGYNNLLRIKNNEVKGITFDVMEKLCASLECEPNDLFEIVK